MPVAYAPAGIRGQVGAKEGRIVGVQRDQQTGVEVAAQRMLGKRGADARAYIRSRVQLQRHFAFFQILKQVKIANGRQRVPNAFRADRERLPDGLGPCGFTGMVGEPQSGVARLRIERAKWLGAA